MNPPSRRLPWTIGIGLGLLVLILALAFLLADIGAQRNRRLPVYSQVADFALTNETGRAVLLADLRGRVWVADIIFTRCPGPCLRMTKQMKELQDALPPESGAKLVSLTTDPDFDTPPILFAYAQKFGADLNRWTFLTGTKKEIGNLAISGLKLSAIEKNPQERESETDLFVHSTIFVIVDKSGQLRGIFETSGEGVDWSKSKRDILAAVKQLEHES